MRVQAEERNWQDCLNDAYLFLFSETPGCKVDHEVYPCYFNPTSALIWRSGCEEVFYADGFKAVERLLAESRIRTTLRAVTANYVTAGDAFNIRKCILYNSTADSALNPRGAASSVVIGRRNVCVNGGRSLSNSRWKTSFLQRQRVRLWPVRGVGGVEATYLVHAKGL